MGNTRPTLHVALILIASLLLSLAGCTSGAWTEYGRATLEDNPERGFAALQLDAQRGAPDAQGALAFLYHDGIGVERDRFQALKWARSSAEAGHPLGQTYLAIFYFSGGPGQERDYASTRQWATPAAEEGVALAQFILWLVLSETDRTPEGMIESVKWWLLSEITGSRLAQSVRIPRSSDVSLAERSSPTWTMAKQRAREWMARRSNAVESRYKPPFGGPGQDLAVGSGIPVARQGTDLFIITSSHLALGCPRLNVAEYGLAEVVGLLPALRFITDSAESDKAGFGDLALLRVKSSAQPVLAVLADGEPPQVGEKVVAAGYPLDVYRMVWGTANKHSNEYYLALDMHLAPGFSGGPVLDRRGRLVGMTVAGIWPGPLAFLSIRPSRSIGLAVKTAPIRSFLEIYDIATEAQSDGGYSDDALGSLAKSLTLRVECSA